MNIRLPLFPFYLLRRPKPTVPLYEGESPMIYAANEPADVLRDRTSFDSGEPTSRYVEQDY